ncbi:MAG: major facilitator superfamily 1 [Ignavibacteria bacterium]|nr:major facilitator superfamily 1 [Ignavibacteria bacterium]
MVITKKAAFKLIILFGIISLLGDMVYEGARSVNGPYLKILGANAAIVGLIAGIGEFLGYGIRLFSGYFSDRTKAYWTFTIIGYGMLLSVPMLSLTSFWQTASIFIILERIGKGIRSPAKDTIVSQATKQVGTGFGFAIVEFLDQLGAVSGPLIYTAVFALAATQVTGIAEYQKGYLFSIIPYCLLMLVIFFAFNTFRHPELFEQKPGIKESEKLPRTFYLYSIFTFLTTFGFVNFVLIGYHLKSNNIVSDAAIPAFYAGAMIVDAFLALLIGKLYDMMKIRKHNESAGLLLLLIIPILSVFIPVFVFNNNIAFIITGVIIWGIVMGAHETIMKAAIADITSIRKRGTGYGIFNTSYGLAAFLGSALTGILYDVSINSIILIMALVQVLAVVVFFIIRKEVNKVLF